MATEDNAPHGTVIHADRQTGGRGRGGREFISPAGGLYFSVIVKPELELADFPLITLAAGVGLCKGIRQLVEVDVQLKWPNDLYLGDKKLAGILTESGTIRNGVQPEFIVIGVGVNVTTEPERFPSSLRKKVISLSDCADCTVTLDLLLQTVVTAILASVRRLGIDKDGLLGDWRQLDYLRHKPLEYVTDKIIPATGIGLADNGQYVIVDHQGAEHHILAGDLNPISLKITQGESNDH